MSIYDKGWLSKFLDPKNQPEEMQEYFRREDELLLEHIAQNVSLVDFGCGFGRHLELIAERLTYGLGIDIDKYSVELGQRNLARYPHTELRVGDCRNPNLDRIFDYAICMNNTLGNIEEKERVIAEMRKAANGVCIFGVYNPNSVEPRKEWYERTGLKIMTIAENYIETEEGFRSYHFDEEKLVRLIGGKVLEIGRIGHFVIS